MLESGPYYQLAIIISHYEKEDKSFISYGHAYIKWRNRVFSFLFLKILIGNAFLWKFQKLLERMTDVCFSSVNCVPDHVLVHWIDWWFQYQNFLCIHSRKMWRIHLKQGLRFHLRDNLQQLSWTTCCLDSGRIGWVKACSGMMWLYVRQGLSLGTMVLSHSWMREGTWRNDPQSFGLTKFFSPLMIISSISPKLAKKKSFSGLSRAMTTMPITSLSHQSLLIQTLQVLLP